MKNNNSNNDKINLAKSISETLSSNKRLSSENTGLSEEKLKKLEHILSDEKALEKIMQSDTAKALLNKYGKE